MKTTEGIEDPWQDIKTNITRLFVECGLGEITVEKPIYACSDSLGETAERVMGDQPVRQARIQHHPRTAHPVGTANRAGLQGRSSNAMIAHHHFATLRRKLWELTKSASVTVVDIIGPMLAGVGTDGYGPTLKAGMIISSTKNISNASSYRIRRQIRRQEPHGLLEGDIVIVGVSRTSKRPFPCRPISASGGQPAGAGVACRRNCSRSARKIVGLIIDPFKLNFIRSERHARHRSLALAIISTHQ